MSLSSSLVPLAECLHILSLLFGFVNSFLQTFLCFFTNTAFFCIRIRVCLCVMRFFILYIGVGWGFVFFYQYVVIVSISFDFVLCGICIHIIYISDRQKNVLGKRQPPRLSETRTVDIHIKLQIYIIVYMKFCRLRCLCIKKQPRLSPRPSL